MKKALLITILSIPLYCFADNVMPYNEKDIQKLESSISFGKPIFNKPIFKIGLYLTKKDNVNYENGDLSVKDVENTILISNLESGVNYLSPDSKRFLVKTTWLETESDYSQILSYKKNPSMIDIESSISTLNKKECYNLKYKLTLLSAVDNISQEDVKITMFSTYDLSGEFNCMKVKDTRFIMVDSINYDRFNKTINKSLQTLSFDDPTKDSYLFLKVDKVYPSQN